jgi:hypothetical protein
VQKKHYDIEKTKSFDNGKVKYNKIVKTNAVTPVDLLGVKATPIIKEVSKPQQKVQMKKTSKRRNLHLEHKPSDEMDLLISSVNSLDLGWKADTCKYQKTHPLYGKQCHILSLAQVSDEDNLLDTSTENTSQAEFGNTQNPKFA